ncbi:MAG: phosphoribosylformylglycinamidine synthase subunit PurL [Ktedonobacteraceae bacterium]
MTIQYIEVRAVSEQHDTQAHRLAREIVQLSPHRLSSLASLSDTPLSLHTASLYCLTGTLNPSQTDQLITQLLVDPVIQEAFVLDNLHADTTQHIVDVFFHAGVTDTLAESVLAGAQMLNIFGIEQVETGKRYFLDGRLSIVDVRTIAESLLYNPVIQRYEFLPVSPVMHDPTSFSVVGTRFIASEADKSISDAINLVPTTKRHLAFLSMNEEELLAFSKAGLLSLNLDEMRVIQQHYREQGREPTDVELETLAQTWSEHCSHKTFKATVEYSNFDNHGTLVEQETIHGLLKGYLMRATEQVRPDWLVSAFSDNAGIVRFTDTHDIAFKVETHNHPSAIEPFGGANTGVGGVIRDILGVSAQPIACTDILCFGPPDTPLEQIPAGVLAPHRIATGVVDGVRDYGNKMGIPTVNGAIVYHRGYLYNPLVFCGCLGILPHGSHPNTVLAGDNVVIVGGRTGRDGVHGATFSSGEMSVEINAQAGTAVQIGAPITEKKVADVIVQARDRKLYSAITDCGAGGFSSAIGEMGADTGVRVDLAHAPLKYQGLAPWEIWLSEAQERMVLAVPSAHLDALLELCAIEEVEASILGSFTDDHHLTVLYHEQTVACIDMAFLHDGRPERTLEAEWKPSSELPYRLANKKHFQIPPTPTSLLLSLLQQPTIASKEAVVRRYDHEVQGATVIKPLVGKTGQGPGDAAVLQPLLEDGTQTRAGIVLSNGVNPLLGTIDPYHMAVNAVDEALRNLTAVGGDITRVSILDNFCWGNPTDPEQLGMLVRAVKGCHDAAVGFKTPFISGKDSLNNEYRADGTRLPVIPTLVISAVGVIDDAAQTIDMSLKTPGNLLYLVGTTRDELLGSYYMELTHDILDGTKLPHVNIAHAYTTMKALGEAIRQGMVRACHDLSEGGLAVAAAEMAMASQLGMALDLAYIPVTDRQVVGTKNIVRLFSESASRFIVEIAPEQWGTFEKHMRFNGVTDVTYIGTVTNTDTFVMREGSDTVIDVSLKDLRHAFGGE